MSHERLLRKIARQRMADLTPRTPCPEEAALASYQSGAGTEVAREAIESHLADCALCLDRLVTLGQAMPALSDAAVEYVLSQAIPQRQPVQTPASRTRVYMALVAAAAVLVMVWLPGVRSTHSPLPGYDIQLQGGVQAFRGEVDASSTLVLPSSRPRLVAAPSSGQAAQGSQLVVFEQLERGFQRVAGQGAASVPTPSALAIELEPSRVFGQSFGAHRLVVLVLPSDMTVPNQVETLSAYAAYPQQTYSVEYRSQPPGAAP